LLSISLHNADIDAANESAAKRPFLLKDHSAADPENKNQKKQDAMFSSLFAFYKD
jgi:hypothetical protein